MSMRRVLQNMELRFLFLETVEEKMYSRGTLSRLYELMARAPDRALCCKRLVELMKESDSEEALCRKLDRFE